MELPRPYPFSQISLRSGEEASGAFGDTFNANLRALGPFTCQVRCSSASIYRNLIIEVMFRL